MKGGRREIQKPLHLTFDLMTNLRWKDVNNTADRVGCVRTEELFKTHTRICRSQPLSKCAQQSATCHLPAGLYSHVGVFVLGNISAEDERLR